MNRQVNPDHCYETEDGVMYMLESVAGEPGWHVTKNGERFYRYFTSLTAAKGWLEHVLKYPSSDSNPYRKGSDEYALREAAPAIAMLLRERGIMSADD